LGATGTTVAVTTSGAPLEEDASVAAAGATAGEVLVEVEAGTGICSWAEGEVEGGETPVPEGLKSEATAAPEPVGCTGEVPLLRG
jgi:hypothetical protein